MNGEVLYLRGMPVEAKERLARLAEANRQSVNQYAISVLVEHVKQPKRKAPK